MPTYELENEEPGILYRHGVRSPVTGRTQIIINMDVVANLVKSEGDWDQGDDNYFRRQVGDWLARRLLAKAVTELNYVTGNLNEATDTVQREYLARPSPKHSPYVGALRYVGELFDVILTGEKSTWLIRNKENTGFAQYFYHSRLHKTPRVPDELWEFLHFCKHRECLEPGCPCVCHTDGRNRMIEVPLVELISDNIDDLHMKWSLVVETVTNFLYEEATRDAAFHDDYLGQIAGIEASFDYLYEECYDPTEWVFMGVLNTSMYYLMRHWVKF